MSHVAIYKWVKKFQSAVKVTVEAKERTMIAVDETCIMSQSKKCCLWTARDIIMKEIVAYHASIFRNSIEALEFLRKVKTSCKGKLPIVLVDKGPWYTYALNRLGFEKWHYTFSIRNTIEQFFKLVKDRTRVFYNNIGCNDLNRAVKNIHLFMKMFCFYYKVISMIS